MDKKEAIPEISSQEFQAELLRCCEQQDKIIECYQLLLEYNKKAEEINRKKRKQLFIDSVILILWLICFAVTLTNHIAIIFLQP
mgnify:CR=1 FL=1